MRSLFFSLIFIGLFGGCAKTIVESKPVQTKQERKPSVVERRSTFAKAYIEVLAFVSNNHRQIISELVDHRGKTLQAYAKVMGISGDQYYLFKRILAQNLPKLIQYNEPDAFQARVQELLTDKRVEISAIHPQIQ